MMICDVFYLFTVRLSLYESVSALMQAFTPLCIVRVVEFKRTSFLVLLPSTAILCTVSVMCEYTFFVRQYVKDTIMFIDCLYVFVGHLYWLI